MAYDFWGAKTPARRGKSHSPTRPSIAKRSPAEPEASPRCPEGAHRAAPKASPEQASPDLGDWGQNAQDRLAQDHDLDLWSSLQDKLDS